MAKDGDTWPERCGIPMLEHAEQELKWVLDCLTDDSERQAKAGPHLSKAIDEIRAAIDTLKGK